MIFLNFHIMTINFHWVQLKSFRPDIFQILMNLLHTTHDIVVPQEILISVIRLKIITEYLSR